MKEGLLLLSAIGFIGTSIFTRTIPHYSVQEVEVLFILFVLFVAVNGLQRSGLISKLSQGIENSAAIPLKLILMTFFLSMFITNDVALIVIVPLTLHLRISRKDLLIILEALAANAGSALTPFGNPQNLFIYWSFDLNPLEFITAIAPFSLSFIILLSLSAVFIKTEKSRQTAEETRKVCKSAYLYGIAFFLVLLTILHILPVTAGLIIILLILVFDRKTLKIDYSLLITFIFFFGLAENMKLILEYEISQHEHIFLFSALISQVISNVPATLVLAKFTTNWEALLWGVNTGGFGSLIGSLANLIAYRLYIRHENIKNPSKFILKFMGAGYIAFAISIGLYFLIQLIS